MKCKTCPSRDAKLHTVRGQSMKVCDSCIAKIAESGAFVRIAQTVRAMTDHVTPRALRARMLLRCIK